MKTCPGKQFDISIRIYEIVDSFLFNWRHQNSKEKTTFWVEHPQKPSTASNSNKRKSQQRPTGSGFKNKSGTSTSKNVTKNWWF